MDARQAAAGADSAGRSVARAAKATRRCSCKKSGCLKLYCECFAGGGRCGDGCQCVGCKNQQHNKLEIALAVQTIEKRSHKTGRALAPAMPATGFSSASSAPEPPLPPKIGVPAGKAALAVAAGGSAPSGTTASASSAGNVTEKEATQAAQSPCTCRGGICWSSCPCYVQFNGCTAACLCLGCRQPRKEKTKGCSCKKSHCLKLYCECLAAQRMCDSLCNCEGCKNCQEFVEQRERAIAVILDRNPMAFQPKVASGTSQHLRGCNCRKSGCMKNYCECFQAGVPCTARCACHHCRNSDTVVSAKKVVMMGGVEAAAEIMSTAHAEQQQLQRQRQSFQQRTKAVQRALRRRPNIVSPSPVGLAEPPDQASSTGLRHISALEMLSESVPAAPRAVQVLSSSHRSLPPPTPSSSAAASLLSFRPGSADPSVRVRHPQPTAMGGAEGVTPSFAKRSYTKAAPTRGGREEEAGAQVPWSSRHPDVTVDCVPPLPDVDRVLDGVYCGDMAMHSSSSSSAHGAMDDAPATGALSVLCQSLLSAAMAVDARRNDDAPRDVRADSGSRPVPPTKNPELAAGDHPMQEDGPDEEMAQAGSDDEMAGASPRRQGSLSPGASGLLCDEDMERDAGDESSREDEALASPWLSPRGRDSQQSRDPERETQPRNAATQLAAAQERAVLQEFSVWLRNMSASPLVSSDYR